MEDDFLFHVKRSYVSESIKFLQSQTDIKQVLFNRGYAETMDDVDIRGYLPFSSGFVVHDYKQGQFPYKNCHYWPHYSFRPSMIDVETILKLGNYDSPNTFFEMDYAKKWVEAGYRSAFFDMVCCRHTGRLTSERNDGKVKNAYELNNENQFNESKKVITDDIVDNFIFIKGQDQMNYDLYFKPMKLEECFITALNDQNCAGFNTLGFFKSSIDKKSLCTSRYFGENDGIYIKKNVLKVVSNISNKTRIKIVGLGKNADELIEEFGPMLDETFELTPTNENADITDCP